MNSENATLALALTPVVVAVASAVLGETAGDDLTSRLWPGLAGIAGLLLLLPQPSLSNWRLDIALVLMPVIVGIASASVTEERVLSEGEHRKIARQVPWTGAALFFSALVFSGLAARGAMQGASVAFSFPSAVLDGVIAWLSVTALARLGAVRWSAQFLVIPLLTLLQAVLLLRPLLDARSWSAFVLLTVSGGYLLVTGSMQTSERTSFISEE